MVANTEVERAYFETNQGKKSWFRFRKRKTITLKDLGFMHDLTKTKSSDTKLQKCFKNEQPYIIADQ